MLMLSIYSVQLFAQGWVRTIDHQPQEDATQVLPSDNGFLLAGSYRPHLDSVQSYFLSEVDTLGQTLWYNTFSDTNSVLIKSVERLSNGDLMLLGIRYTSSSRYLLLARHSASGNLIWQKTYMEAVAGSNGYDLMTLPGDTLIIGGTYYTSPNTIEGMLMKLNANGDSLDFVSLPSNVIATHKVLRDSSNSIIVVTQANGGSGDLTLFSYSKELNFQWAEPYAIPTQNTLIMPEGVTITKDGHILVAGFDLDASGTLVDGKAFLAKYTPTGDLNWYKTYTNPASDLLRGVAVREALNGNYVITAAPHNNTGNNTYYDVKASLVFTDTSGAELFHKVYNGPTVASIIDPNDLTVMPDGGFLICGSIGLNVYNEDLYLIRTDSLGNIYRSILSGKLFGDANANCQPDNGETDLQGWIVGAFGVDSFYAVSDTAGNYNINCDTGSYVIRSLAPSSYWDDSVCLTNNTVTVLPTTDTLYKDIAIGKLVDCADLNVDVSTPFLRRCIQTPPYTISYCNNGTAEANNAYIDLNLSQGIIIDSAQVNFTDLGNGTYRFNIGNVDISECQQFNVYVHVDCASTTFGQSFCVSADMYPVTNCLPPHPTWDGAQLELETQCMNDSIQFLLRNTGNNMASQKTFTIIQDDVMYANGNFQLNNGAQMVRNYPANGATWTFVTEQTDFFPGNRRLVRSVEGCGTNGNGAFSMGYLTQYPQVGPDPSSDEICLVAIGSYDPNDKATEPQGIGMEGTIDKEQELTYRIRFQNTGTDTAFLVVILDTLSANLDPLSIHNVSSSHPMNWNILQGNVLEFSFVNIQLPDSNVNEPASHGFVTFDIDLINDDLPIGTEILNTANIYFDQNPAVVTNTTLNTIGELYKTWLSIEEMSDPKNRVTCYPNPTKGLLNIQVDGTVNQVMTFEVYDLSGKLIEQIELGNIDQHQLYLNLDHGMYLYHIRTQQELIGSGKLMAN